MGKKEDLGVVPSADLKKKARECFKERYERFEPHGGFETYRHGYEAGYREALGPISQEERYKLALEIVSNFDLKVSALEAGCKAADAAFSCLSRLRIGHE